MIFSTDPHTLRCAISPRHHITQWSALVPLQTLYQIWRRPALTPHHHAPPSHVHQEEDQLFSRVLPRNAPGHSNIFTDILKYFCPVTQSDSDLSWWSSCPWPGPGVLMQENCTVSSQMTQMQSTMWSQSQGRYEILRNIEILMISGGWCENVKLVQCDNGAAYDLLFTLSSITNDKTRFLKQKHEARAREIIGSISGTIQHMGNFLKMYKSSKTIKIETQDKIPWTLFHIIWSGRGSTQDHEHPFATSFCLHFPFFSFQHR